MPFYIQNERDKYRFNLSPDNLPIVDVMQLGNVAYIACCSICGCLHELPHTAIDGGDYEPVCLLKCTHKAAYAVWLALHPEAADYTRLRLKYRAAKVIPLSTSKKPPKRLKNASKGIGKAA